MASPNRSVVMALLLLLTVAALLLPACDAFLRPAGLVARVAQGRGGRGSGSSGSTSLRMGIFDDVSVRLKNAMKCGNKEELGTLRNIRSAFLTETKSSGAGDSLPDDKCLTILKKLAKQRNESIDMYVKGGRDELAEAEKKELDLISAYLPTLADAATVEAWADAAIAEAGAKGPAEMGKVMGLMMKQHKAEMDGKQAQGIVAAKLKAMQ